MLRLLICDDAPDARERLRASLSAQPGIEVVAEAENGEEAVSLAVAHRPDVVLMDVQMPVLDGVAATRRIRDVLPQTRIVAYAGSDDAGDVMAMMEAGADAYCLKGAPLWELERAVAGASDPLVRLAHAIARSVNGGGTAELVARELAELTGASFAATYLASADTSLSLAALSGPGAPESLHSAPGVVQRAFSELALAQADTHELGELYRLGAACGDAIAAPLVVDGQVLGALFVALPASVQATGDPELVSAVADLASAALANERRIAMTHAEARRDALTGLANKRAFDELVGGIADRRASDGPVSLVLFDLDGFKRANDEHGHVVGDEILREVGRVFLASSARRTRSSASAATSSRSWSTGRRAWPPRWPTVCGWPSASSGAGAGCRRSRRVSRRFPTTPARPSTCSGRPTSRSTRRSWPARTGFRSSPASARSGGRRSLLRLVADPAKSQRGLRLLVVDDDPGYGSCFARPSRSSTSRSTRRTRRISRASGSPERHPDVVVLDVSMPGTDGLTFCRQLKADPATAHIGVVLLTGSEGGNRARGAGERR
jgi:PleD family two-component response regulator